MEVKELALVFDCGTQSTRGFLVNKYGDIVVSVKEDTVPYYSIKKGFAERDTEEYWKVLCSVSLKLKEKAGELWNNIVGMSLDIIRSTYVYLDSEFKPTRPTIVWVDKRLGGEKQKFSLIQRIAFSLVGMGFVVNKQRRMSPSTWIKENTPEVWEKTKYATLLSAYINYRISGRLVDVTTSQASRLPYNYRKERWQKKSELTYSVFNVEREKLCELVKPGELICEISEEVSAQTGIPIGTKFYASGGDKACETLGVGGIKPNVASISFGTTATLQITTKKYVEPQKFMPAYNAMKRGYFNPEIQIYRGFWMVTWFKEEFASDEMRQAEELCVSAESLLDMKLCTIPAGSEGLVLQPFWSPGLKTPEAKGTILGFRDCHTKYHFYRAIIEGICYGLLNGMQYMERKSGQRIKKLAVSGGGANSDEICQICADVFNLPVYRVQTPETSGLGVAMMVFNSCGIYKDLDECEKYMVHPKDEFTPNLENHKVYKELYGKIYKNIYTRLKGLYMKLYDIVDKEK